MSDSNLKVMMKMFRQSVERLALDSDEQIRRLNSEAFSEFINVDELALDFDDGWVALKWRWEATGWTVQAKEVATQIDGVLESMRDPKYWDDVALQEACEWQHIRNLAGQLISIIE